MQESSAARHSDCGGEPEQGFAQAGAADDEHAGGGGDQIAEQLIGCGNIARSPRSDQKELAETHPLFGVAAVTVTVLLLVIAPWVGTVIGSRFALRVRIGISPLPSRI